MVEKGLNLISTISGTSDIKIQQAKDIDLSGINPVPLCHKLT